MTNTELERLVKSLREEIEQLKSNLQTFFDSREFPSGTGTAWRQMNHEAVNLQKMVDTVYATPAPQAPAWRMSPSEIAHVKAAGAQALKELKKDGLI